MNGKTPQDRQAEAAAREAEAKARYAETNARKAELEHQEWESELARQARNAQHKKEIAEADASTRKAAQTLSDELTRQKLETEAKRAIAEAQKATASAEREQVEAQVPDFTKIDRGETKFTGEQPAFGSLLGRMALEKAAAKVVEQLKVDHDDLVLLTNDADLASTDAVYVEVITGLDNYAYMADELLESLETEQTDSEAQDFASVAGSALGGAIVSAIPGLFSLLSSNRTLSTYALTADMTAGMAAVASSLTRKARVQIDDFRITVGGRVAAKEKMLGGKVVKLMRRLKELEGTLAQNDHDLAQALDDIAGVEMQVAGLEGMVAETAELKDQVSRNRRALRDALVTRKTDTSNVEAIRELTKAIIAFFGWLHKTPSGEKRSPFAAALLRQQLRPDHSSEEPTFTKVLFVQASAGSINQLLDDKPWILRDRLHLVGSAGITFWLMDVATSDIEASGVTSGKAEIRGKIGKRLESDTDLLSTSS